MKKKAKTTEAFHEFAGFVKRLLAVPKSELDEKLRREKLGKSRDKRTKVHP